MSIRQIQNGPLAGCYYDRRDPEKLFASSQEAHGWKPNKAFAYPKDNRWTFALFKAWVRYHTDHGLCKEVPGGEAFVWESCDPEIGTIQVEGPAFVYASGAGWMLLVYRPDSGTFHFWECYSDPELPSVQQTSEDVYVAVYGQPRPSYPGAESDLRPTGNYNYLVQSLLRYWEADGKDEEEALLRYADSVSFMGTIEDVRTLFGELTKKLDNLTPQQMAHAPVLLRKEVLAYFGPEGEVEVADPQEAPEDREPQEFLDLLTPLDEDEAA